MKVQQILTGLLLLRPAFAFQSRHAPVRDAAPESRQCHNGCLMSVEMMQS